MTIREIQTGQKNEILRQRSKEVPSLTKKLKKLILDMFDTLKKQDGLGLAAPQVGENVRIALVRFNNGTKEEMVVTLINPEIIWKSEEMEEAEEGCLSLPDQYVQVMRYKKIKLKFTDAKGMEHILELSDLNARVVQHEIDHLDGILICDKE